VMINYVGPVSVLQQYYEVGLEYILIQVNDCI